MPARVFQLTPVNLLLLDLPLLLLLLRDLDLFLMEKLPSPLRPLAVVDPSVAAIP